MTENLKLLSPCHGTVYISAQSRRGECKLDKVRRTVMRDFKERLAEGGGKKRNSNTRQTPPASYPCLEGCVQGSSAVPVLPALAAAPLDHMRNWSPAPRISISTSASPPPPPTPPQQYTEPLMTASEILKKQSRFSMIPPAPPVSSTQGRRIMRRSRFS